MIKLRPGQRLPGGIVVGEFVGEGGYGTVHRARLPLFGEDQDVALKTIHYEDRHSTETLESLREEGLRMLALPVHGPVCTLYSWLTFDRTPVLLMELVEGMSLRAFNPDWPWPMERVLPVAIAMFDALAFVHRKGIVHLDVKPENILIEGASGMPKLTDFGIAAALGSVQDRPCWTPEYAAPERRADSPGTASMDVYSLCVTLAEVLTSTKTIASESATAELPHEGGISAVGEICGPPDKQLRIDPLLEILQEGLRLDPASRPSASVFVDRLSKLASSLAVDVFEYPSEPADSKVEQARAYNLASLLTIVPNEKRYREAEKVLDRISHPHLVPLALTLRSEVARERGDRDKAHFELDRAVDLAPERILVMLNEVIGLIDEGESDRALKKLRRLSAMSQANSGNPIVESLLGFLLIQSRLFDEAVVHMQNAVQLDPEHPKYWNDFGAALENLGKIEEAIYAYRKALSLDDELAVTHQNLAYLLAQRGQHADAELHRRRARELGLT
ncbi:protein kinase [Myxococcota bacterium]